MSKVHNKPPQGSVESALESLDMARELIQEAKGAEGPKGGYVTDHLDAAETWLDYVESYLRTYLFYEIDNDSTT